MLPLSLSPETLCSVLVLPFLSDKGAYTLASEDSVVENLHIKELWLAQDYCLTASWQFHKHLIETAPGQNAPVGPYRTFLQVSSDYKGETFYCRQNSSALSLTQTLVWLNCCVCEDTANSHRNVKSCVCACHRQYTKNVEPNLKPCVEHNQLGTGGDDVVALVGFHKAQVNIALWFSSCEETAGRCNLEEGEISRGNKQRAWKQQTINIHYGCGPLRPLTAPPGKQLSKCAAGDQICALALTI